MDEKIKELILLTTQRQELVRQIEQLEILKQKQEIDNQLEQLKEAIRHEIETNDNFKTGKQVAKIGDDELCLSTAKGKLNISIADIDAINDSYRTDKVVEEAIALPDGDIYVKSDNQNLYVENGEVKEKLVNEDLIKNIIKAGGEVPNGVMVKRSRPSVSLKLNGQSL